MRAAYLLSWLNPPLPSGSCNRYSFWSGSKTKYSSGIRSDPNRPDDPEYIVRLVGQVVRASVETVEIVNGLPAEFGGGG